MCEECGVGAAGRYEIVVAGHLGARLARTLDGWEVQANPDTTTTLIGSVDQAALHGTLGRLRDLGITLLAVRRVDREAAASG